MTRSSATASNAELRHAIGEANDAAVKALLAQDKLRASLVGDDGAIIAEFEANQRQRENLAAVERMAAELQGDERARRAIGEASGRS